MTNTEANVDSVANQSIKDKFIQREVKACFSYEMESVLKASELQGGADLPHYDEIENLYEYVCPECGDTHNKQTNVCENCDHTSDISFDSQPKEIFEWWIISSFLAGKLKVKGEAVLEWGSNHYWGRTTTGQAIALDSVISSICSDMEILEGQKYDWSK